ncbi:unnamed protein product [Orchesella dallaii]|uniref:Uncharacterized protein n=1 Tax=Orchesella dallaii TaxID=48710 RepID=A0ABP1Q1M2_9HEXA
MGENVSKRQKVANNNDGKTVVPAQLVSKEVEQVVVQPMKAKEDPFISILNKALPILMRNQDLPISSTHNKSWSTESILSCRLLNKSFKLAVDDCLGKGLCQELFKPHIFRCSTPERIYMFTLQADWINGTPFFLSFFKLSAEYKKELCESGLQLLQNHGHFLRRLSLLNFLDNHLPTALSYSPNIECLTVFSGLSPRDHQGKSLELTLPSLPKLKNVWFHLYEHRRKEYQTVAPWASSFLAAYGLQLRTLRCDHSIFLSGITWETFSSSLTNLEDLQVTWIDSNSGPLFEILSQVKWYNLKRLCFKEWFGEAIDFSNFGLETLDNFRNTLEELHLPKFVGQSWMGRIQSLFKENENSNDGGDAETFRFINLKRVRARESNVDSPMWASFKARFVNLEILRFEKDNSHTPYCPPTPSKSRMEWFFLNFSKLQYILWPRDGNGKECGRREYIAYMKNGKSYQVYENRKSRVLKC